MKPTKIEVSWDTQDPSNPGWAWWAYDGKDLLDSGPLQGRRNCSNATLTTRARAAAGVRGTRTNVTVTR